MKYHLYFVALLALTACTTTPVTQVQKPPPPAPEPIVQQPPKPVILSVVGTSDVHGHIERAAVFSGFIDRLRAVRANDGGVVLVDAGDIFQGTLATNQTEGAAMIRAYNAIGYSALALGNHEFDYGPEGPKSTPKLPGDNPRGALFAAVKLANFPVLSANIVEKQTGKPVQWPGIKPSTMLQVAGINVGVIGVEGANALAATIAANVSDLKLLPLAEVINREAKQLRANGAQVVVAVAHEGSDCKSFDNPDDISSCAPGELLDVVQDLEPDLVNVVVGGHTHRAIAHRVNGIAVIQSYAYGRAFGRVDLQVDAATGKTAILRIFRPQQICEDREDRTPLCKPSTYEGQSIAPNKTVLDAIAQDAADAKHKSEENLGATLPKALAHGRTPLNSDAAAQVAEWMLQARTKGQMAIFNTGGVRSDLDAGPLHYGSLYEMFPFDNRFAIGTVKVQHIRKLLRDSFVRGGTSFSVAGVTVKVTCKGSDVNVEMIRKGKALKDTDTITLIASDYLATTPKFERAGLTSDQFTIEDDPTIRESIVALVRNKGNLKLIDKIPIQLPGWPVSCPTQPATPSRTP